MPKAFAEHEKTIIRQQLHEKGQQLFALHGLKKTSVDDLVQAVGISKGAFYLFYASKEELLLEILVPGLGLFIRHVQEYIELQFFVPVLD